MGKGPDGDKGVNVRDPALDQAEAAFTNDANGIFSALHGVLDHRESMGFTLFATTDDLRRGGALTEESELLGTCGTFFSLAHAMSENPPQRITVEDSESLHELFNALMAARNFSDKLAQFSPSVFLRASYYSDPDRRVPEDEEEMSAELGRAHRDIMERFDFAMQKVGGLIHRMEGGW